MAPQTTITVTTTKVQINLIQILKDFFNPLILIQDSWPRDFIFSDKEQWLNDLKKLKEDCTFAEIYSHLWSNVPRVYDASINMETRLEECSTIMKKHACKIFEGADLDTSTCKY